MQEREDGYSIDQVADLVGVPVRTIRYYITEGLVPGPGSRGKMAAYRAEHVDRLRLIRLLTERRLPLGDIRQLVATLSPADVAEMILRETHQTLAEQHARISPKAFVTELLNRSRAGPSTPPRLPDPDHQASEPAPPPNGEQGASWQHFQLAPGLELLAHSDDLAANQALIARILALVRGAQTSV